MKFKSQSALLDVGSRSRKAVVRKWLILFVCLLGIYILIRNYSYISKGMLAPNFRLIHKAYDFNFLELPLMLLGFAIVCAGGAFLWTSVRRNLGVTGLLMTAGAAGLFMARYYITYIEPQRLVVHHVRLETTKLKKTVRILHLSDIQSGGISAYEQELFSKIRKLNPDLILNTGDLLQVVPPATFDSEFPKLLKLIRSTNPQFGTFAVFGDTEHELYNLAPNQLLPLKLLSSRSIAIETDGGTISLHGLSLYQSRNPEWAARTVEEWLDKSKDNEFRILLGHAPDFALGMGEKPIDLCLAGHTHGGQVRLPWYGPLVIDSEVPMKWSRGFRRIGIPYLNVSAGAGSNRYGGLPPIRLNCPTEMTLIELVPPKPY